MDSTPPATATSINLLMMLFANVTIAVRPDRTGGRLSCPACFPAILPRPSLARDVITDRALLQSAAHRDIFHPSRPDRCRRGALPRRSHGLRRLALGVIESAAIGLADRRSGSSDDDGLGHMSPHRTVRRHGLRKSVWSHIS